MESVRRLAKRQRYIYEDTRFFCLSLTSLDLVRRITLMITKLKHLSQNSLLAVCPHLCDFHDPVDDILCMALSPDGSTIAFGGSHSIRVRGVSAGGPPEREHTLPMAIVQIAWHPFETHAHYIFGISRAGKTLVLDLFTGRVRWIFSFVIQLLIFLVVKGDYWAPTLQIPRTHSYPSMMPLPTVSVDAIADR